MDIDFSKNAPLDLYITADLHTRAAVSADHLAEKIALQELAARMLDQPDEVLPLFVELAMTITGGISAGISLFEGDPAPGIFRWRYLRGSLSPFEDATTPRNFSPCGVTLDQGGPVLSSHPERFYNWISDAGIVVPEVLLVPLHLAGAEPLGTLWIVSDTTGHFRPDHARAATELARFAGIALRMLRMQAQAKAALAEQATIAHEMSHRVKNLFLVAQSLVRTTSKMAVSKDEMADGLLGRFTALARAHALVRPSLGDNAGLQDHDLLTLIRTVAEAHEHDRDDKRRVQLSGSMVPIGEHAVSGVALLFHELTTNSVKYGALAAETGWIEVISSQSDDGNVGLLWREHGGPVLNQPPEIVGFGSKLVRDTVVRQFGGSIEHEWLPEGLQVHMTLSASRIAT